MIPHTYFQSSTIRVLLCQSISVDLPDSVLISKLKCSTTLWSQCYFDAVDWCICHVVVLVPILVFCDIVAEEYNTPIRVHDFQISCVNRYNHQMNCRRIFWIRWFLFVPYLLGKSTSVRAPHSATFLSTYSYLLNTSGRKLCSPACCLAVKMKSLAPKCLNSRVCLDLVNHDGR